MRRGWDAYSREEGGRRLFSISADRRGAYWNGRLRVFKGGEGANSMNYGNLTVRRNNNVFDSIDYLSYAAQRCTHKRIDG